MDILRKRLQQALDEGRRVDICTGSSGWVGLPIHLDDEYVELIAFTTEKEEDEAAEYDVTNWIVKIDQIHAFAIVTETWDSKRLNSIPTIGDESSL